ncbi:MAG: hypothetical protein JWO47_1003 [Candidatus Saccharibacteria bacterium]|nr:hypothetical protein [Candidatus Saccharibacteria bacterium]
MGNGVIAFLVALGAGAWIFSKVQRTTGNNTKSSLIVAGISVAVIFGVVLLLLGLIPKSA